MDRYPRSNGSIVERANSGIQAYMAQVYGWMTCGLLLTAFVSWYAANTPAILNFIFSSQITFFGLIIAQLALVFVISGMVNRLSGAVATSLFMLYSALTGLTLSSIFIAYTYSSIASTFVVTAGMFGAMSLYGYTTKRDLSGFGSMLFMPPSERRMRPVEPPLSVVVTMPVRREPKDDRADITRPRPCPPPNATTRSRSARVRLRINFLTKGLNCPHKVADPA